MSDDLVRRLRDTPNWMREGFQDWKDNMRTYDRAPFEAADRIEELEVKLSESEALLEKAVEGLENVSRLVDNQYADRLYTQTVAGWEQCADDVKDVARTTLAELSSVSCANTTGVKDD